MSPRRNLGVLETTSIWKLRGNSRRERMCKDHPVFKQLRSDTGKIGPDAM